MKSVSRLLLAAVFGITCMAARADGLILVSEPITTIPSPDPGRSRPPLLRPYRFAPMEVIFHKVRVQITDPFASTTVDQEFYNPNNRQLEGYYLFPIPKGAQIDKFSMEIGGKEVEAELLSAEKARRIYEDIVRQMKDPALLEYAGQDAFRVRIFPIEPMSRKRIRLSYTQVLKSDGGMVSYVYPLNTEKYSAAPVKEVAIHVDVETKAPLKTIYSPSHSVDVHRDGSRKATVAFEAKNQSPDTDFQLLYASDNAGIGVNLMTYKTGVEEGYYLLMVSPGFEIPYAKIVPKDVAFVLDSSGSMSGKKMRQAIKALQYCVDSLNDRDRFEVIRFSTEAEPLFGRLAEASEANRGKAASFIANIPAKGGTAIDDALKMAAELRPSGERRPYAIVFLTDGLPTVGNTDENQIVSHITDRVGKPDANTRLFCFGIGHDVNTHLLDTLSQKTRGASQYVLPEEDIEVKVSNFFEKIKEPVLTQVRIGYPEGIRTGKILPAELPDLFRGEQLAIAGRYAGQAEGQLLLSGMIDGDRQEQKYAVAFPSESSKNEFIPRLWATRRVGWLLDEIRLHGESSELKDEVTELARRYGIVTPYTSFLIVEDEKNRGVPLEAQTMPQLQSDAEMRGLAGRMYRESNVERSGAAAVARSRYGLAMKSAQNARDAGLANVEAERGLIAAAPSTSKPSVTPSGKPAPLTSLTQPTRFVNGQNFFQAGNQWIDARIQRQSNAARVRIQFNSAAYFDLIAKKPEVTSWLALGQNIQFILESSIYEIYE